MALEQHSPSVPNHAKGNSTPKLLGGAVALSLAMIVGCAKNDEKKEVKFADPKNQPEKVLVVDNSPMDPDWRSVSMSSFKPKQTWEAEWGDQEETNPIYWWKVRYDKGCRIVSYLEPRRKMLVNELADVANGKNTPITLLEAIEDFNREIKSGYDVDYFPMFGGARPKEMPDVLQFSPLPKIAVVTVEKK